MRYYATGRRKEAIARVWLEEGSGKIIVNGKPFDKYFTVLEHQNSIIQPLEVTGMKEKFNVKVKVVGGGMSGQAGAVTLGIARALVKAGELRDVLKKEGLLKRDPRVKERKKYGLRKSRKARQYSKR